MSEAGVGVRTAQRGQIVLAGERDLSALRRDELAAFGEEGSDLSRVADLGVALGAAWVVGLSDDAESRVLALVSQALERPMHDSAPRVDLSPFAATHALGARCSRAFPRVPPLRPGDDVRGAVRRLFEVLDGSRFSVALGGGRAGVGVRVVLRDDAPAMVSSSVDPDDGEPETVVVMQEGRGRVALDRKTMRPCEGTPLDAVSSEVERAADFADRAQLSLGRPVSLSLVQVHGRLTVVGVTPLLVAPAFADEPYRRVALLGADDGAVAPLSIDTLDKALAQYDAPSDAPRVARFYARAYRRVDLASSPDPAGMEALSIARASAQVARIAAEAARPLAGLPALEETHTLRVRRFQREDLEVADRASRLRALRERQRAAVEVLELLESARVATRGAVSALEATCGTLPRECVHAIGSLSRTKARRRVDAQLRGFATHLVEQVGAIPEPHRVPPSLRPRWAELRRVLSDVRPLGLDARAEPYGASDEALRAGLLAALAHDPEREDHLRREAHRRLRATARSRTLGRVREALAATLYLALGQIADRKGRIAEMLASALLCLRQGALAVGALLVEEGTLDAADDALYLDASELEEAASGEPGAYTARVRLRREADLRWRSFEAPRRIASRR